MVACLSPAEFILSWDPTEKIIASDFELDGAKRDCASTNTPKYLFLCLA
jgi:hypothetical protein